MACLLALLTSLQLVSDSPPGFYVPAVLFFDENEDLHLLSVQAHVLRLAQVSLTALPFFLP
jgi:hypothetical protein